VWRPRRLVSLTHSFLSCCCHLFVVLLVSYLLQMWAVVQEVIPRRPKFPAPKPASQMEGSGLAVHQLAAKPCPICVLQPTVLVAAPLSIQPNLKFLESSKRLRRDKERGLSLLRQRNKGSVQQSQVTSKLEFVDLCRQR
jgi:hypothetical protein